MGGDEGELVGEMDKGDVSFFTSIASVFLCLFGHLFAKIASMLKSNFLFDNILLSPMMFKD